MIYLFQTRPLGKGEEIPANHCWYFLKISFAGKERWFNQLLEGEVGGGLLALSLLCFWHLQGEVLYQLSRGTQWLLVTSPGLGAVTG